MVWAIVASATLAFLVTGCAGRPTHGQQALATPSVVAVPGVELAVVVAEPTLAPIEVTPGDMGADPAIEALMVPYAAGVAKFLEPIGTSTTEMARPTDKNGDSPLGNWMADITREAAGTHMGQPVDLAVMNGGGIRATLPAGPITREAILKVMPFDNRIVVVELTGPQMREVLELLAKWPRSFAVSNAIIEHQGEPPRLARAVVGGVAFDETRSYRIALSDFLADGGDGVGALLKGGTRTDTGILVRDAMEAHVRALTTAGLDIEPPAESTRYRQVTDGGARS